LFPFNWYFLFPVTGIFVLFPVTGMFVLYAKIPLTGNNTKYQSQETINTTNRKNTNIPLIGNNRNILITGNNTNIPVTGNNTKIPVTGNKKYQLKGNNTKCKF
jgi:hypothetical protein